MNPLYYLKRFLALSRIELRLFLVAFLLSIIITLIVQIFPLKYYLFLLQSKSKYTTREREKALAIKRSRKTIHRVVRLAPWHCNCLVKSILMKNLLSSLGVESNIIVGCVKTRNELLSAHAFVRIDKDTMYLKNKRFTDMMTFF